jgi:hypothetical protein
LASAPKRKFGVSVAPVSGERGVDGVGFAKHAKRPDEGLDLAGVSPVGRHVRGDEGGQQIAFIASRRLADDEKGRAERGGEFGQGLRLIGDRSGAAQGGVMDDDRRFADVASDEARGRGGWRHLRLSSSELGIVCGRASGDGGPFNSSSDQGSGKTVRMTAGLQSPIARRPIFPRAGSGGRPNRRIPFSGTTPSTQTPTDNREPDPWALGAALPRGSSPGRTSGQDRSFSMA